jgi:hypothetical protein
MAASKIAKLSKLQTKGPRLGLARGLLYGEPVGGPSIARSSWALGRRSFVAFVTLLATSCISPTLPPDDPPRPEVEIGNGVVLLTGVVPQPNSVVFAQNNRTGLIFGQETATGFYSFSVEAEPCDPLDLWYTAGIFRSSPIRFVPAALSRPALPRSECLGATPPRQAPPDAGEDRPVVPDAGTPTDAD